MLAAELPMSSAHFAMRGFLEEVLITLGAVDEYEAVAQAIADGARRLPVQYSSR